MRHNSLHPKSVASSLILCSLLALLTTNLAACADNKGTVGQTFLQGANQRELRNAGPVTLAVDSPTGAVTDADGGAIVGQDGKPIVPIESLSTSGTGPGGYALADAKQARWLATNTVMRNVYFSKAPDGQLTINSNTGTDLRVTADSLVFNPATGQFEGKGFRFETLASTPFEASNASLAAWKEAFNAQTDAQKQVVIQQLQASAETLKTVAPTVAQQLVNLVEFLTKP